MKKKVSLILSILLMMFIFYMSHQPANISSQQSGGVIDVIKTIPIIGDIMLYMMEIEIGEFIIRKSAHMFLYCLLAVFVFNSMYDIEKKVSYISITSFIYTFIYACSDEFHQLFIPGRSGEIRDILVDSTGAVIGILIMYLIVNKSNKSKPGRSRM